MLCMYTTRTRTRTVLSTTIAAVALATAGCTTTTEAEVRGPGQAPRATPSPRTGPPLQVLRTRPGHMVRVGPLGSAHLPGCHTRGRRPSDLAVFSARSGYAFRQWTGDPAGPFWADRHQQAVAGFDRANCDLYNWTGRTLLFAAWYG